MPRVTVILPIYNEAGLAAATFDTVLQFANDHPDFRFLFVDDGSTDQTRAVLDDKITDSGTDRIQVTGYSQNGGKGHAVKFGVQQTDTDRVMFTDADLAYKLDHLPALDEALNDAQVAIGCRSMGRENAKNITLIRRFTGKTFNVLARLLLNLPYTDTQAGLKGFDKVAADDIFSINRLTGFSFDVELIYIAKIRGYRIREIPACVNEQHSDKSSKVKIVRDSMRMFMALVRIRINHLLGRYAKT